MSENFVALIYRSYGTKFYKRLEGKHFPEILEKLKIYYNRQNKRPPSRVLIYRCVPPNFNSGKVKKNE